jgi:hypothetical protein
MYRNKYGKIKIIESFNMDIYIYIHIYILFCVMWSDETSLG